MSPMAGDGTRLPLVPLTDIVHFPRTELKLHVHDPSYDQLVRDLAELDEESRWIGIVLMKPGPRLDREGRPEIFPAGTAARVRDLETDPDGHADILVYGELRFELDHEITGPYRHGVVRPVAARCPAAIRSTASCAPIRWRPPWSTAGRCSGCVSSTSSASPSWSSPAPSTAASAT